MRSDYARQEVAFPSCSLPFLFTALNTVSCLEDVIGHLWGASTGVGWKLLPDNHFNEELMCDRVSHRGLCRQPSAPRGVKKPLPLPSTSQSSRKLTEHISQGRTTLSLLPVLFIPEPMADITKGSRTPFHQAREMAHLNAAILAAAIN